MSSLVGKILANRYRVDSFLGRGGMAEVYKVWDNQRMVFLAMKVLHQDMAEDRVFLRRFKREAQTLSRLEHPHIVRFHGLQQDGRFAFMLMEYVAGVSLRTEIFDTDGKPLSLGRIRTVMTAVCGALYYAHNKGMVHCDIKPANIMLDASGDVRLADFGIARMTDGATATMVGAGTPAYMAPEQIRGKNPVPQTDIYGLGVVLYEMLTGGERPFTGDLEAATGSTGEKIRWGHLNALPPSPKKWNHSISPQLEAVVWKSLAKEPENRYQNPLELLNALGRAIGNVPPESFKAKKQPVQRFASYPRVQTTSGNGTGIYLKISGAILIAIALLFFLFRESSTPTGRVYPSPSNSPSSPYIPPTNTATLIRIQATDTLYPTQEIQATYTPYPTQTPYMEPTETPKPIPTVLEKCSGADWMPQPKIIAGINVEVCTKSDRLLLRERPEQSAGVKIALYPGGVLQVIDGPYCADGSWWWKIIAPINTKYANNGHAGMSNFSYLNENVTGYVREGTDATDKYFICP